MRFLHLCGGPNLHELDLSRCAEGIDLVLQNCPQLARIRVPDGGEGAVLHLDMGEATPALEVVGAIRSIDACWSGGDFAAQAPAYRPPLRNATIGDAEVSAVDAELLVHIGATRGPGTGLLELHRPVRQLILIESGHYRVRLAGSAPLEHFYACNSRNLVAIEADADIERVRLESCPAVERIRAGGHALSLVRGTGAEVGIEIDGGWQHLTLVESPARRLSAHQAEQLLLRDCEALTEARLALHAAVNISGCSRLALGGIERLSLDGRAVSSLLREAAAGGELVRNYYLDNELNLHSHTLHLASEFVVDSPVGEEFKSCSGSSWRDKLKASGGADRQANGDYSAVDIYDAISSGDGEDVYLGDGMWISSSGSLDDRGR